MNTDSNGSLGTAFGIVLTRSRSERKWTAGALATAAGLPNATVAEMERGDREPTLTQFFNISHALGESPAFLLISLIAQLRADPTGDTLYKSRASDFSRLYRLGYFHDVRDFREHQRTFNSIDEATAAARRINTARHQRKLPPLSTLTIYVRLGHAHFAWDPEMR